MPTKHEKAVVKEFETLSGVATITGIPRRTLRDGVDAGEILPALTRNNKPMYKIKEVERWNKKRRA